MERIVRGRFAPLALFLVAYLGYVAIPLGSDAPGRGALSLGPLALMIGAVVWARRRQDEVMRAIADRATQIGFWVGFLALFVSSAFPELLPGGAFAWPLWTAPLFAWVGTYAWLLLRLRIG